MSTLEALRGDFRVGRAITRAFAVLQRDFVKFFVIAAIITSPTLLLNLLIASAARGALSGAALEGSVTRGAPLPQFGAGLLWAVGLGTLGVLILITMLTLMGQAMMLYGAIQDMRGKEFSIGQSFKQGFARFLPILGALILVFLAIFLIVFVAGLLLSLVGRAVGASSGGILVAFVAAVLTLLAIVAIMLYLACSWFVALPACVLERTGPVGSFSRSAFLTKGHRWRLLGLLLLILLVNLITAWVIGFISFTALGAFANAISSYLWGSLFAAFQSVLVAVVYLELREAKEGIDLDRIAAVFE
jgi:hypothetical protein